MTTWRKMIDAEMRRHGDSWGAVISIAVEGLSLSELDREFDCGYGRPNGDPFTLWTLDRVYFPCVYDGAEWVASVPRYPCDEVTRHIGDG